jgi:hypothetical protein
MHVKIQMAADYEAFYGMLSTNNPISNFKIGSDVDERSGIVQSRHELLRSQRLTSQHLHSVFRIELAIRGYSRLRCMIPPVSPLAGLW